MPCTRLFYGFICRLSPPVRLFQPIRGQAAAGIPSNSRQARQRHFSRDCVSSPHSAIRNPRARSLSGPPRIYLGFGGVIQCGLDVERLITVHSEPNTSHVVTNSTKRHEGQDRQVSIFINQCKLANTPEVNHPMGSPAAFQNIQDPSRLCPTPCSLHCPITSKPSCSHFRPGRRASHVAP